MTIELILEFTGLRYHRGCEKQCFTTFGQTDCFYMDVGLEKVYLGKIIGFRISVNDEVVAQKGGR